MKSSLSFLRMSVPVFFAVITVLLAGQPSARAERLSGFALRWQWFPEYQFALLDEPRLLPASQSAPPQPGQLANPSTPVDPLSNAVSAAPLTVGQKFNYRVVQTFGLRGMLGALAYRPTSHRLPVLRVFGPQRWRLLHRDLPQRLEAIFPASPWLG